VWNEGTHQEHFIRLANFRTAATKVGFLVPTPTVPALAEEKEDVFKTLAEAVKNHQPKSLWERLFPHSEEATAGAKAATDSPVIKVADVAGYEASVLSLKNRTEVDKWLFDHKFPIDKPSSDWLDVYVKKGWVLTAFVVKEQDGEAKLKAVRMTFQTDRPYYPYREPPSQRSPSSGRTLEVHFLSNGPFFAQMGNKDWVGKEEVSDRLTDPEVSALSRDLPGIHMSDPVWLTSFLDWSDPRIGTADVVFTARKDIPYIPIMLGAVLVGLVLIWIRIKGRRV